MTDNRVRMSTGDAVIAHVTAIALTGVVMWVLHVGDHSSGVVFGVGVGFYAAVLAGMFTIGRARARRRDARQKANFDAYIAERDRRLHGSG